jgi:hypothetical protein
LAVYGDGQSQQHADGPECAHLRCQSLSEFWGESRAGWFPVPLPSCQLSAGVVVEFEMWLVY